MSNKFLGFIMVAIVIILLVPACAEQPSVPTTNVTTKPPVTKDQPQYGGILKQLGQFGPTNLGVPYEPAGGPDITAGAPAVETLLRLDEKGLPVPWLATAWKVSDDLKSITLSLRKGVKFHDETDFNADAVKYLLDLYRTSNMPELKSVTSIDIIDDYSVRLNLAQFQTPILCSFYGRAGLMVSPTSLKKNGKEYHYTHPVGTGPFVFADYRRDQSLKWTKFDGYWQKGKPYLDGIEITYAADPTVSLMSFESGQAMVCSSNAENADRLRKTGKYTITSTTNWISGFIGDSANTDSPFAKLEVRQAVNYAIDRDNLTKSMGFGFQDSAQQLTPNDSWFFDPTIKGYPYNPAKAKELLTQAGYPAGFKAKLTYVSTWNGAPNCAPIQANLRAVGIDIDLNPVQQAVLVQARTKGWKNELIQFNFPASVGTDFGQSCQSQISAKAPENVSIIHPEEIDAKINQSLLEADKAKSKVLYQDIMKLAVDKYALTVPVWIGRIPFIRYPQVHDMRFYEFWYSQWTPEDTWLSK